MLLDDLLTGSKPGMRAPVFDLILFWAAVGVLALRDISCPIHFWHGDADTSFPLAHGEHMASLVRVRRLTVRPGESHLGGSVRPRRCSTRLFQMCEHPTRRRPRSRDEPKQGTLRADAI